MQQSARCPLCTAETSRAEAPCPRCGYHANTYNRAQDDVERLVDGADLQQADAVPCGEPREVVDEARVVARLDLHDAVARGVDHQLDGRRARLRDHRRRERAGVAGADAPLGEERKRSLPAPA